MHRVLAVAGSVTGMLATPAFAQEPTYTTFTGFTTNVSVDGQGGWTSTNPSWDEEVVDVGGGDIRWRVSNAVTSGSFGDQPIAPPSDLYAGESGATHAFDSAVAVTDTFYGSFTIQPALSTAQPGLDITVSPSDSSGKRQSFLSIEDNGGAGIDLEFFDSQGNHPSTNPNGGFVSTDVATGLDRSVAHEIAFEITFIDGNIVDGGGNVFGNDIVKIFVNGELVHTGTTWESYYQTTTEGQVPPTTQAIDTLLFRISGIAAPANAGFGYWIDNVFVSSKCPDHFQGFETDLDSWEVFSSSVFYPTRVPSGTDGVTSASGSWHATASATGGQVPATNWGGYSAVCDSASSNNNMGEFPANGYTTSIDIWLDMAGGWADDTRFDWSSAINQPNGVHQRDFIFNCGFYGAADGTSPGAGADRFIVSASNNSGQPPYNPPALPIAITSTGWYTFEHRFYRTGSNVLACEFSIYDSSGTLVNSWIRSDPSDVIGAAVGGNRYGWFPTNGFDDLHFDNATRTTGGGTAELALTLVDCQDDFDPGQAGYQVAVQLEMLSLTSHAGGFQAFVDYDMGTFLYRGDLSSYTSSPFPNHISPILQADDGRLELDGSDAFGGNGTDADALLATLVFDVLPAAACVPSGALAFETGGSFASELSFASIPLDTALTDPAPFTLDDTPPVLDPCPSTITQSADADSAGGCAGAIVTFTAPGAVDNCDPSPIVVSTPPSGSFFPAGTTTVTCVATDACGNSSSCTFDVVVTATNDIDVAVELVGVNNPVSRCILFRTADDCSAETSQTLSFVDHDFDDTNGNGIVDGTEGGSNTPSTPVRANDTVTVPCGFYTELCAKDEQHTKWAPVTATLTARGNYTASGVLSLTGGDGTNDGDVDINDVTLFIAQFGGLTIAGGCPFDGFSLDSDFDNDGAIGVGDYAFLVASWLTQSSCACTGGGGGSGDFAGAPPATRRRANDDRSRRADLNADGWVDVLDVELLEGLAGLSGDLSAAMRR